MNSEVVIREASAQEIEAWDGLIRQFEDHRVTHTLGWLRSLEASIKGKLLFLVYEKHGEIVACLPGMIVNVGFLKLFGSPLPGWQTVSMGPIFNDERITCSEVIEPLASFLELNHGVHHIEILGKNLDPGAMCESSFRGRQEFTFEGPLFPQDENKALKQMKGSTRRNIARAQELGLQVRFRDDEDFVDEVYDQISEVYLRGGNVVPFSKKRVADFYSCMKQSGSLVAVSVELAEGSACIATGLFTIENRELLLWSWTHRTKYRWYRPTELMTWAVMQKAMQLGCTSFDLMGPGNFKAKFGATLNGKTIRWVRSRYAWLTAARDVSEKVYRFQQSLRGKYARRFSTVPPE